MLTSRYRLRLFHHLWLATTFVALSIVFMHLFPKRDFISRLSIGTAYPALFLTAAALLLGPLNVLRRKRNPVSFDLRRDVGIWAGISAVAHAAVGLNVHLRGRMWLYFVNVDRSLRRDAFGLANYTGTAAVLMFLLLLSLSNDVSLRKLGAIRWKSLQRWTYAAVVLTAVHAIAYQHVEARILPFRMILYVVLGTVLTFQVIAALKSGHARSEDRTSPSCAETSSGKQP